MSKQKKLITAVVVVAILLMGIGYAAFNPTTLTIGGSATATGVQDNFKVYYTGEKSVGGVGTTDVTVAYTDTDATVEISGLTKEGDSAFAILEIINESNGVDAESVTVTPGATDTAYFDIETEMCKDLQGSALDSNSLPVGEKIYVKVTATLLKTPTVDEVSTDITATITATPVQSE